MRVWLTALAVAAVLGGSFAAAARAEYVPGATYTGTLSHGRSVSFTVSPDGAYVTSFYADYLFVNCASLTGVGASTIRSIAFAVLGNGITSRSESAPARIMTMRSSPSAMPPCGGVP